MSAWIQTAKSLYAQTFISGDPPITEANCPDQTGRVLIVTGGTAGVGFELSNILYASNGTVYIAARSQERAEAAIARIKSANPDSKGQLHFLHLDLSDLSTIKTSANEFLKKESQLHVLFNNAGVANPPPNSRSAQGHELHLGTNCLGPYLFTRLVLPALRTASASSPPNTVRIIWASSQTVDMLAPAGGIVPSELRNPQWERGPRMYSQSKVGNWFLAARFAQEFKAANENIVSITVNPGNLKSEIWRNYPTLNYYAISWMLKPSIWGAYTDLWAGLSEEVTVEDGGRYVLPWGKWHPCPREDILEGMKTVEEGGTGVMKEFGEWCDEFTREFM
ncbi:NAD(P)-binding protein [Ascobolus immersus RN42]|uniref:NAD(P)-binding protein n=1 Tax=Ascobolus immersus RN42 TaxID=1160509 RepID=A0A3N4IEY0_ASCIM|nr:NAD(P)-binding protein [Ascobolus immersus RN42]